MPTSRDRVRCRERLQLLGGARLGEEELGAEITETLLRAIGFSSSCWQLADPDSQLPTVHRMGQGEVPFEHSVPRLIALYQGTDPADSPMLLTSGRPAASMYAATGGDLARSRPWQECLGPSGIGDVLVAAGRDRFGTWGCVYAGRERGDPPFTDQDIELLTDVSASLGAAMRRSAAARTPPPRLTPPPPGIIILDDQPRETSWTPEAHQWLRLLPDAAEWSRHGLLPSAVYGIAGRLLAQPHTPAGPISARVRTTAGTWAVLDGGRLEGAATGGVAVTIRAATAHEVLDVLGRAHGLTPRERQLVRLVADGLNTQQIAERLYITPNTVKDHLKAIFEKAGVSSRGELVHLMTGNMPDNRVAAVVGVEATSSG
jgi:DNA-binding CsgD family transcriptional regulator